MRIVSLMVSRPANFVFVLSGLCVLMVLGSRRRLVDLSDAMRRNAIRLSGLSAFVNTPPETHHTTSQPPAISDDFLDDSSDRHLLRLSQETRLMLDALETEAHGGERYLIVRPNMAYGWGDNMRGLMHSHALASASSRHLLFDWRDVAHHLDTDQSFGYQLFIPRNLAWNVTEIQPTFLYPEDVPRGEFNKRRKRECKPTYPWSSPEAAMNLQKIYPGIRRLLSTVWRNQLGDNLATMYPAVSWAFPNLVAQKTADDIIVLYPGELQARKLIAAIEENNSARAIISSPRPWWNTLRRFIHTARRVDDHYQPNAIWDMFSLSSNLAAYMDNVFCQTFLLTNPSDPLWLPDAAALGGPQERVLEAMEGLSWENRKWLGEYFCTGITDFMKLGPYSDCAQLTLAEAVAERADNLQRTFDEYSEQDEDKSLRSAVAVLAQQYPKGFRLTGVHFRAGDGVTYLAPLGDFRHSLSEVDKCFEWAKKKETITVRSLRGAPVAGSPLAGNPPSLAIFLSDSFPARKAALSQHKDLLVVPQISGFSNATTLHNTFVAKDDHDQFFAFIRNMIVEWLILVFSDSLRSTLSGFSKSAAIVGDINNVMCAG